MTVVCAIMVSGGQVCVMSVVVCVCGDQVQCDASVSRRSTTPINNTDQSAYPARARLPRSEDSQVTRTECVFGLLVDTHEFVAQQRSNAAMCPKRADSAMMPQQAQ